MEKDHHSSENLENSENSSPTSEEEDIPSPKKEEDSTPQEDENQASNPSIATSLAGSTPTPDNESPHGKSATSEERKGQDESSSPTGDQSPSQALDEVSSEEARAKIEGGETLQKVRIKDLSLDEATLENPVVLEDCEIENFQAQGTHFKEKVVFQNCRFLGDLQMNYLKRSGQFHKTHFDGGLEVENCQFEGDFLLRHGQIKGEVLFTECKAQGGLNIDRCHFYNSLRLLGKGSFQYISLYRAQFERGLEIRDWTFEDRKGVAFDGKSIFTGATLEFRNVTWGGSVELKGCKVGKETHQGWVAENCRFGDINLQESLFWGDVEVTDCEVKGKINGSTPQNRDGYAYGKAALFIRDASFFNTRFKSKVNFYGARFQQYANFKRCTFEKGAKFDQAEFQSLASFWESEAKGRMRFRKAHFQGKTDFGNVKFQGRLSFNKSRFEKKVTFYNNELQKDVFFTEAYLEEEFKVIQCHFQKGLAMKEITLEGPLSITETRVDNRLILTDGVFRDNLIAPALEVGTWASLAQAEVQGVVDLSGIRVGTKVPPPEKREENPEVVEGSFYLSDSTFHGPLKLNKCLIEGDLHLNSLNCYHEVELIEGQVGNDFKMDRSYFRGMVRCEAMKIAQFFDSYKARFKEEASFNALQAHKMSLSRCSFDGGFTLRRGQVETTFTLNSTDVDGKIDLSKSEFGRFFFTNLLVDHFLITREVLGEMLSSEKEGSYEQAKNEYGTLKQAFLQRNQYRDMDWAYYRLCRANRKARKFTFSRPWTALQNLLDWLLLDLGFGYGTRPMNIAGVALVVVLLFGGLVHAFPQGMAGPDSQPLESISLLDSVYMSVITFASMDYGDYFPYFDHWLKHLLALEGLLGIFLVTLFVATISRKIIRS